MAGTSYTRQSATGIVNGQTIGAGLFNSEYNQLENAFSYSAVINTATGHRHDGTAGEGGNIYTVGDEDFKNKIVIDGQLNNANGNNRIGFFVEVSSSAVEQVRIQDGAILPVTTNDIDFGTSSLEFKSLFVRNIQGTGNGVIDLSTTDEIDLTATTVQINGNLDLNGQLSVSGTVDFEEVNITNAGDIGLDKVYGDLDTDTHMAFGNNTHTITFNTGGSTRLTIADTATTVTNSLVPEAITMANNKKISFGTDANNTDGLGSGGAIGAIYSDGTSMYIDEEDYDGGVGMGSLVLRGRNVEIWNNYRTDEKYTQCVFQGGGGAKFWWNDQSGANQTIGTAASMEIKSQGIIVGKSSQGAGFIGHGTDEDILGLAPNQLDISGTVQFKGTNSSGADDHIRFHQEYTTGRPAINFPEGTDIRLGGANFIAFQSTANAAHYLQGMSSAYSTVIGTATYPNIVCQAGSGAQLGQTFPEFYYGISNVALKRAGVTLGGFQLQFTKNQIGGLDDGPLLDFNTLDSSPNNGGISGKINFYSSNSSGAAALFSHIRNETVDVSAGGEDGALVFSTAVGGTATDRMTLSETGMDVIGGIATNGTVTADGLALGDGDIAGFGTSIDRGNNWNGVAQGNHFDLEIRHDGSNSYIKDFGTGNLAIEAADLALRDNSNNRRVFCTDGAAGSVELYYGDSSSGSKLNTTATGINVTGTVTASAIDLDHDTEITLGGTGNKSSIKSDTHLKITSPDNIVLKGTNGAGSLLQVQPDGTNTVMQVGATGASVTGTLTATAITADSITASQTAEIDAANKTMSDFKGQKVIHTGSGAATYTFPDVATGDKGTTWTVVNASTAAITISRGTSTDLNFSKLVTSSDPAAVTTITVAKGGVVEFVVTAANEITAFGSGF